MNDTYHIRSEKYDDIVRSYFSGRYNSLAQTNIMYIGSYGNRFHLL